MYDVYEHPGCECGVEEEMNSSRWNDVSDNTLSYPASEQDEFPPSQAALKSFFHFLLYSILRRIIKISLHLYEISKCGGGGDECRIPKQKQQHTHTLLFG